MLVFAVALDTPQRPDSLFFPSRCSSQYSCTTFPVIVGVDADFPDLLLAIGSELLAAVLPHAALRCIAYQFVHGDVFRPFNAFRFRQQGRWNRRVPAFSKSMVGRRTRVAAAAVNRPGGPLLARVPRAHLSFSPVSIPIVRASEANDRV